MLPIPPIPGVLLERRDWTVPSPEWEAWARATFIDSASPLCDPGLAHLEGARIGFLLTNATKVKGGRRWAGSGGAWKASGDGWTSAQQAQRMIEWFGFEPDFLLTFDVTTDHFDSVRGTCFVVNHELKHCGYERDKHGGVKRDDYGRVIWATEPHYAELNVGDLARWGAAAVPGGETLSKEVASPPSITDEMLRFDEEASGSPEPKPRRKRG